MLTSITRDNNSASMNLVRNFGFWKWEAQFANASLNVSLVRKLKSNLKFVKLASYLKVGYKISLLQGWTKFIPIVITVGRRHEKRYIVLFTCKIIRAIHLKIAHWLDTDGTVMTIRRCRKKFGSNKNFGIGMFQSLEMLPSSSPLMGGSWERLVKSVKDVLKETLKEIHPKEEVLQTLIAKAENMVNNWPLTYISRSWKPYSETFPTSSFQWSGATNKKISDEWRKF